MAAGDPITKAGIILRFNQIVTNQLSPALNGAAWWYGNVPGAPPEIQFSGYFGSRNEIGGQATDLDGVTNPIAASVFNQLNAMAQRFGNVRVVYCAHQIGGIGYTWGYTWNFAHVNPGAGVSHAASIPVAYPAGASTGNIITWGQLDDFLVRLINNINYFRTSWDQRLQFETYSCHSSCHSSCHGSRGRR